MANHDSCGGLLCETPIELKQEVNKIIKNPNIQNIMKIYNVMISYIS